MPCLRIYEKSELNTEKLIDVLCTKFDEHEIGKVLVVLDEPYLWKKELLEAGYNVKGVDDGDLDLGKEFKTVFVTDNLIKAMNLEFTFRRKLLLFQTLI